MSDFYYETLYFRKKTGKDGQNSYKTAMIVTEFVPNRDLFDYICHTGTFSESEARTFFHQIIEGLEHIYERDYCHRDVKLENILLDEDFNIKICDFGFARSLGLFRGEIGTD